MAVGVKEIEESTILEEHAMNNAMKFSSCLLICIATLSNVRL